MLDSIVILQPPGGDLSDLLRAFQAAGGKSCEVRLVASEAELLTEISDKEREHVAVVPQLRSNEASPRLDFIAGLRAANDEVAVVIVSDEGNVEAASRAIQAGANDFLVRGPQLDERVSTLLGKLRALFEVIERKRKVDEVNSQLTESLQASCLLLGRSPPMRKLLDRIQRVAKVPRPILIVGERGSGKELVARAIHVAAGGSNRPMVTINCASFSDTLLESELFGHERGAFTGADASRRGKFELADGGTLFLDEIAHMSRAFQQKILRVVEYGVFQRVGGVSDLQTTARIVTATNCDLREKIRQGEFLADLYDRLSFEVIEVPPLRQRGGDIELLASHFLVQFARETAIHQQRMLSPAALAALRSYSFPGNVRELKNIIERAACREGPVEIGPADLALSPESDLVHGGGSFEEKVDAFCRRLLGEAISQTRGNQAAAARLVGLSYHQFRYYAKKYLDAAKFGGS